MVLPKNAFCLLFCFISISLVFTSGYSYAGGVSVVPGLVGFGTSTPAGRGGKIYLITNLNSSGRGSFSACVLARGPRVCLFEVSGYITLKNDLIIKNPFLTIAGQTAPSPGITIRNGSIRIATHDVLMQHIRVRTGDKTTGNHNGDSITVIGKSHGSYNTSNIVIDHVSASWAWDEVVSTNSEFVHDVTISNSIVSEGLHHSVNPSGSQACGVLVGGHSKNILLLRNLFAHHNHRNPYLKGDSTSAVINNLIYNPTQRGVQLEDGNNYGDVVSTIIGNVMSHGPSSRADLPILQIKRDVSSAKIFMQDNITISRLGVQIKNRVWNDSDIKYLVSDKTADLNGIQIFPSSKVNEVVLNNAGARPKDRDAVDKRVVRDVKDITGMRINCVSDDGSVRCKKNAGGWPVLAANRRKLELPANPHNDDDNDGYTNLEAWLHKFSSSVEH